jgi:hypothetical protein
MTTAIRDILLVPEQRLQYLEAFVKIPMKDAEGVRVPFKAWPVQKNLILSLTGRDVVVKDAQLGITSIISGDFLVRTFVPDTTTVIIAHKGFTTERLLHRVEVMHSTIPDSAKPRVDHNSANELRFPDINSVIYIATAREEVAGRGEPIHQLLLSECAFYPPDALKKIIIPALQRVPRGGRVVKESTPNGEDPILYDEVQKALAGDSNFKLHVLLWWENPDNWLQADYPNLPKLDGKHIEESYDEKERQLVEANGLSPAQVRWRRWKIREAGELFFQEHPEGLDTCFLIAGEAFYDTARVRDLFGQCYSAPKSYQGAKVWYEPEEGVQYVIGIDPGQGKVTQSVATVWKMDGEGLRHEATLAGLIEPVAMGKRVKELGLYYNNALLIPEANGHGLALCAEIRDYRRLYWRKDVVSGRQGSQIGWQTSVRTKPFMMSELARNLPTLITHDQELVREIAGWREAGVGKPPFSMTSDDVHDAACLALVGATSRAPKKHKGFIGRAGFDW